MMSLEVSVSILVHCAEHPSEIVLAPHCGSMVHVACGVPAGHLVRCINTDMSSSTSFPCTTYYLYLEPSTYTLLYTLTRVNYRVVAALVDDSL